MGVTYVDKDQEGRAAQARPRRQTCPFCDGEHSALQCRRVAALKFARPVSSVGDVPDPLIEAVTFFTPLPMLAPKPMSSGDLQALFNRLPVNPPATPAQLDGSEPEEQGEEGLRLPPGLHYADWVRDDEPPKFPRPTPTEPFYWNPEASCWMWMKTRLRLTAGQIRDYGLPVWHGGAG